MTVNEIYSKIVEHTIKGIMLHSQLANYYDFLNLHGYKRCHEYHSLCETILLRRINRYFINNYNMLIPESEIQNPKIIPSSWIKYTRIDVDNSTRKTAIKDGITQWRNWEIETKKLLEDMCTELIRINEIASAQFICCILDDVTQELKYANREFIKLKGIDFNLDIIVPIQDEIHEEYRNKIKDIGSKLC